MVAIDGLLVSTDADNPALVGCRSLTMAALAADSSFAWLVPLLLLLLKLLGMGGSFLPPEVGLVVTVVLLVGGAVVVLFAALVVVGVVGMIVGTPLSDSNPFALVMM